MEINGQLIEFADKRGNPVRIINMTGEVISDEYIKLVQDDFPKAFADIKVRFAIEITILKFIAVPNTHVHMLVSVPKNKLAVYTRLEKAKAEDEEEEEDGAFNALLTGLQCAYFLLKRLNKKVINQIINATDDAALDALAREAENEGWVKNLEQPEAERKISANKPSQMANKNGSDINLLKERLENEKKRQQGQ